MSYLLLAFLGLIALGLFIAGRPYVAAWCYRRFGDPYPPEAAEAPKADYAAGGPILRGQSVLVGDVVDEHFKTAPREQRLDDAEVDRLVAGFDWPRYATWLKEPS